MGTLHYKKVVLLICLSPPKYPTWVQTNYYLRTKFPHINAFCEIINILKELNGNEKKSNCGHLCYSQWKELATFTII